MKTICGASIIAIPCDAEKSELKDDEPCAANEQVAQHVGMLARVEEDAGPRQKDERRRAEVSHPTGEEDSGGRSARRNA